MQGTTGRRLVDRLGLISVPVKEYLEEQHRIVLQPTRDDNDGHPFLLQMRSRDYESLSRETKEQEGFLLSVLYRRWDMPVMFEQFERYWLPWNTINIFPVKSKINILQYLEGT